MLLRKFGAILSNISGSENADLEAITWKPTDPTGCSGQPLYSIISDKQCLEGLFYLSFCRVKFSQEIHLGPKGESCKTKTHLLPHRKLTSFTSSTSPLETLTSTSNLQPFVLHCSLRLPGESAERETR